MSLSNWDTWYRGREYILSPHGVQSFCCAAGLVTAWVVTVTEVFPPESESPGSPLSWLQGL